MMDLGLLIIKPFCAGKTERTNTIICLTSGKLEKEFPEERKGIIYNVIVKDGTELTRELYDHLRREWNELNNMLKDFKRRPFHPFVFYGPEKLQTFLKEITGKTRFETNERTIRGKMAKIYGVQPRTWFNFVHTPSQDELKRDLIILKNQGIIPNSIEGWENHHQLDDELKETLNRYKLI